MKVLIAGCGYLGTETALRLTNLGHQVWGLRRNPDQLPKEILPVRADLTDTSTALTLPASFDWVVYSVGPDQRSEASYRAAYVDGFARLAERLRRQSNAPRIVFTSSTGIYGQTDGAWVDETTPPQPRSPSACWLAHAEEQLSRCGLAVTVLRLSGLYGPGRRRMIDRVRTGAATCVEGPPRYSNRIHRDDAAAAAIHLLGLPDPAPLYVASDDAPADQCTVYRWLADRMAVPHPKVTAAEPSDDEGSNKRCRNDRLKASGFAFRYPSYREGYLQVLGAIGLLASAPQT